MSNNNSSPFSPGDQPAKAAVGGTPKGSKKATGVELTAVEGLLFFNIIRFNKDTSAVDWDQVAIHSNLKNAASAKVRFRQIQKKYDFDLAPKGTPKAAGAQSGGSQKRKANAQANEGDKSGATEETPSKKPKQPARKRNAATGGKGKAKAKDNANEQKTGDDTSTTGDDGAVDNEAIVKMEAGGVEDGEEDDVELAGGNTIMKSSPAGPVGDDYLPPTVAPSVLTADPMQNRAPPFFGGGILPPAFQPYHMGTGPYGQLDVDPAGIFAGFHGLPFGGQNNQHAASPYAGRLKREDDEEHAI